MRSDEKVQKQPLRPRRLINTQNLAVVGLATTSALLAGAAVATAETQSVYCTTRFLSYGQLCQQSRTHPGHDAKYDTEFWHQVNNNVVSKACTSWHTLSGPSAGFGPQKCGRGTDSYNYTGGAHNKYGSMSDFTHGKYQFSAEDYTLN